MAIRHTSIGTFVKSKEKKLAKVVKILDLMEESYKGKAWLIDQISKEKLKIRIKSDQNSVQILQSCSDDFLVFLEEVLLGKKIENLEDVLAHTKTFHWFFTDVVAASDPTIPIKSQVVKVMALNELLSRTETYRKRDPSSTVIAPTGDGIAIGFGDSPEKPLRLAIELQKSISKYNKKHKGKNQLFIRTGIDMGSTYFIKDLSGRESVWGPGIITARRLMDLGGKMHVFASERLAGAIVQLSPEYKRMFHPIGKYEIKHGEKILVYNLYSSNFGNKKHPKTSKAPKQEVQEYKSTSMFKFENVEISLDILDAKTMLVHHKWLWNIINITNRPMNLVFYSLDGDVPKDFPELNVRVSDENKNELENLTLHENKPLHKEFTVQLKRPIKPKQKNRFLLLEYDWEEPEKSFSYRTASGCKKFKYYFSAPKEVQVKNKILKVDPEIGIRRLATPTPKIRYSKNKTEIKWETQNLKPYDTFRFEW